LFGIDPKNENGPGSSLTRGRRPVPQQDGVARYQNPARRRRLKTDDLFSPNDRADTT
jgi:hypothetical protein